MNHHGHSRLEPFFFLIGKNKALILNRVSVMRQQAGETGKNKRLSPSGEHLVHAGRLLGPGMCPVDDFRVFRQGRLQPRSRRVPPPTSVLWNHAVWNSGKDVSSSALRKGARLSGNSPSRKAKTSRLAGDSLLQVFSAELRVGGQECLVCFTCPGEAGTNTRVHPRSHTNERPEE